MEKYMKNAARDILPEQFRRWLIKKTRMPAVGKIRAEHLMSAEPVSRAWGADRGLPIDRFYIENYLLEQSHLIKGIVLEIGDNTYTLRFGGAKVQKSEVLHASSDNPNATYVGDLTDIPAIPSDYYDCVICTQTLQLIPDLSSAIKTLARILKPGGSLIVSLPGISQIYFDPEGRWPDYWRFTTASAKYLFNKVFPDKYINISSFGNVLVSSSFLYGLATEELSKETLLINDPYYQFIILMNAKKNEV